MKFKARLKLIIAYFGFDVLHHVDPKIVQRCSIISTKIRDVQIKFFILDEHDVIQRMHLAGKFYEEEELEIIERSFSGGTFVDIGANIGNHSIYVGKYLPITKIIAFEPNSIAHMALRINIDINDLRDRCVIHKVGLFDAPGRAGFRTPDGNLGGTKLLPGKGDELELARGDDILRRETVSFMKIDVEGLEMEVLRGLEDTISKQRPTLFVEVDEANTVEFLAYLDRHGYTVAKTYKRYAANMNYLALSG
jgi:FkbM family methyltransferase